jgi:hypothetical protein
MSYSVDILKNLLPSNLIPLNERVNPLHLGAGGIFLSLFCIKKQIINEINIDKQSNAPIALPVISVVDSGALCPGSKNDERLSSPHSPALHFNPNPSGNKRSKSSNRIAPLRSVLLFNLIEVLLVTVGRRAERLTTPLQRVEPVTHSHLIYE